MCGGLGPDAAGDELLVVVGQVHEGGEVLAQADRVDDREADLARRHRGEQPQHHRLQRVNRGGASFGLGLDEQRALVGKRGQRGERKDGRCRPQRFVAGDAAANLFEVQFELTEANAGRDLAGRCPIRADIRFPRSEKPQVFGGQVRQTGFHLGELGPPLLDQRRVVALVTPFVLRGATGVLGLDLVGLNRGLFFQRDQQGGIFRLGLCHLTVASLSRLDKPRAKTILHLRQPRFFLGFDSGRRLGEDLLRAADFRVPAHQQLVRIAAASRRSPGEGLVARHVRLGDRGLQFGENPARLALRRRQHHAKRRFHADQPVDCRMRLAGQFAAQGQRIGRRAAARPAGGSYAETGSRRWFICAVAWASISRNCSSSDASCFLTCEAAAAGWFLVAS